MGLLSSLGQQLAGTALSTAGAAVGGLASAGIGAVTQAAQQGLAAAGQIFSDANPSVTQKKVEALGQLGASGQLPSFKSVSDIKIETGNGEDQTNTPSGFHQVRLDPFGKPIVRVQSQARTMPASGGAESAGRTLDFMVSLTNPAATRVDKDTLEVSRVEEAVIFTVSPTISERRSADYDAMQLLHHQGQILKYKWTNVRSWGISGKLVSRNSVEAEQNLERLNRLRAWVMPFNGEGTANEPATKSWLGAPPPVLILRAYGDKMVGPVPVVIKDYSWEFPNEVDYIETEKTKVPFPTVIAVTVSVDEAYSPAEYSGFDWIKYLQGNLSGNAFKAISAAQVRQSRTTSAAPTQDLTGQLSQLQTVDDVIRSTGAEYGRYVEGLQQTAYDSTWSLIDGVTKNGG